MKKNSETTARIDADGYQAAMDLLYRCNTANGFVATPNQRRNYSRIWGRDSSITGLAALLSGDGEGLKAFGQIHQFEHESTDHGLDEKTARLEHLIRANYWFSDAEDPPRDVCHEILFKKGREAVPHCKGSYWMPFFSPFHGLERRGLHFF